MKTACCLVLSTLVGAALMTRAAADSSDADTGPHVMVDQDGIPLSVTHPQERQPTQEEVDAYQKAQAMDKDWLLRAYEKQRQHNSADDSNDLYYRLSSNKDLADLAGIPVRDPDTAELRTGGTGAGRGTLSLRTDPAENGATSRGAFYKPLITPLGSSDAASLRSLYSTLQPTSSPSMLPRSNSPRISPTPEPQEDQDPAAIETPGMIAAEKDPLLDKASANLTLDLLARDPTGRPDQPEDTTPTKLELPLPTNAALLQKTQDAALTVPGQVKSTVVTPVRPNPPLENNDEPTPIEKMPQANPVRSSIADPRDIFYR